MIAKLKKHPFFIRLLHWEYWNSKIVYLPLYPYWLWLSIKARSFFFITAANPNIRNGGFIMESKKSIYDQLPQALYPPTLLFKEGTSVDEVRIRFQQRGLAFPLIAKPDYGERGLAVKKIDDWEALQLYVQQMPVAYLLQEFICFPLEAGIFYVKGPGAGKGKITGIVNKYPVVITGDGKRTLKELVFAEDRYRLQWKHIQQQYKGRLDEVIKAGVQLELIPYGNHSRGAKFTDETYRLNDRLEQTLLDICAQIPEFYFGRLDVRFESWEALEQGLSFSIIEVNGSGSEPTHIYDPKHSIFFAWREIARHWRMLYDICKLQHRQGTPYLTLKQGQSEIKSFRKIEAMLAAHHW